jgi:hypothetical protein
MQISTNFISPSAWHSATAFVTALVWDELLEHVGKKVRNTVSLEGVPHLVTAAQAMKVLFAPHKKSQRVDFTRIAKKWLKREFAEYAQTDSGFEPVVFQKTLTPDLVGGSVSTRKIGHSAKSSLFRFP